MEEVKEKKTEEIKKEAEGINCPVRRASYYIKEFLAGPMCGKCFPCEMGTYEAGRRLEGVMAGKGTEKDINALRRISSEMLELSRCKKGKDTAKFLLEWLDTDAFKEHIPGAISPLSVPRCQAKECKALIQYRIIPEKCTLCGLCKEACPSGAIIGEKRVSWRSNYPAFEIRQKRCTKAGECFKVCPVGAVEVIDIGAGIPAMK